MRIQLIAACLLSASVGLAIADDVKKIEKLAADCEKTNNIDTCEKLFKAFNKIKDQPLLAKIALETKQPPASRTAVSHIDNQALLAKIAIEANSPETRLKAISKIDDQAALASIVRREREAEVRKAAIERLSDPKTYAAFLQTETDPAIRASMTARLNAVVDAGKPVPGFEPLVAPDVMDPDSAWEAHLKVGWKVFKDYREWYETQMSSDERWFWESSKAPRELSITSFKDPRPAPARGPFAVIAIEYMAKERSLLSDLPSLLIGDYFDPTRQDYKGLGHLDPFPVGRMAMKGDIWAWARTNNGRDALIFYKKDALAVALWFLTEQDIRKEKFSLFLMKHKPIRFRIPVLVP